MESLWWAHAFAALGIAMFARDSWLEGEWRAFAVGCVVLVLWAALAVAGFRWEPFQDALYFVYGAMAAGGLLIAVPARNPFRVNTGTRAAVVGEIERHDERDNVFSRFRAPMAGAEAYRAYYDERPEREEPDARRRAKGFMGEWGRIDKKFGPTIAMIKAVDEMSDVTRGRTFRYPEVAQTSIEMPPKRASALLKGMATKLGADLVGVCRVDPIHVYGRSAKISPDATWRWGESIDAGRLPAWALVFALEMDYEFVMTTPRTPQGCASVSNYGRGCYLAATLARWIASMGWRAETHTMTGSEVLLVPLAVDAGLGEVGRNGYLVSPRYGARTRLFAVLTDMPLEADRPISIGVDEFCRSCKKCAEACPSKSLPTGDKVVIKGVRKWALEPDGCFAYWAASGVDCAVCMGICPFSRPDTMTHRIARAVIAWSWLARRVMPHVDNLVYGRSWASRRWPSWLRVGDREAR